MSLRTKALLIIGLAFILLAGTMYAVSRFVLIQGLATIEQRDTRNNVGRVLSTLSQEVSGLESTTADWSAWDDTYAFIEDANSKYIESNLVDGTFTNLRLNVMLFIHSSGRIVFGKAFDLDKQTEIPIPPGLIKYISNHNLLAGNSETGAIASGIALLDDGPILISSQPILTSKDEGPARGTLIFVRYLDAAAISYLSQITLFPLTIQRVDGTMAPDFQKAWPSLLQQEPVRVQPLSAQYVAGYTLIKDIYGEPALIMRVDVPRNTYQLGQIAISYYLLSIFGVGMTMAALALIGIEKQILSRFTFLIRGLNGITTSGNTSARITMKGKDELTQVANTVNGMLDALQESENQLKEAYQQEKDLRQGLETEIKKRLEYTRALVHELKTPITPVLAATELLLEEIKEERLAKLVQSIDRSASNLNQRIDELLDLARGELDMLELNREPLDPAPLLRDISEEMKPVAVRNGQFLDLELLGEFVEVWADRQRLRQVILNLLTNALKFTPRGGSITLRAREDNANLAVEVQDTGPGISSEDQERLFNPYYRVESDRERFSGLGLGLSLAKKLVELHGGRIWVESQPDKGSTFGFTIPLSASKEKKVELKGTS